jgi:hypothetical protein
MSVLKESFKDFITVMKYVLSILGVVLLIVLTGSLPLLIGEYVSSLYGVECGSFAIILMLFIETFIVTFIIVLINNLYITYNKEPKVENISDIKTGKIIYIKIDNKKQSKKVLKYLKNEGYRYKLNIDTVSQITPYYWKNNFNYIEIDIENKTACGIHNHNYAFLLSNGEKPEKYDYQKNIDAIITMASF